MELAKQDFEFVANLVKKRSGIALSSEKTYLVDARLTPVASKFGLKDVRELITKVNSSNDDKLVMEIVDAITTNETSFFRDMKPFEQFRTVVIPRLIEKCPGRTNFRIWSAGCATGQEPYSIAMSILENQALANYQFEIMATDISSNALDKAKAATYTQFEVQRGLPITLLIKYFTQQKEGWILKDQVKTMVKFSQVNLIEDFSQLGYFDIILCRNTLMYFEPEMRVQVLHNLKKHIEAHGTLFLGCTETIMGLENIFASLQDTIGIFIVK